MLFFRPFEDEVLSVGEFGSRIEAQVVVQAWRIEHNPYRPTAPSAGLIPAETRAAWTTEHQPAFS